MNPLHHQVSVQQRSPATTHFHIRQGNVHCTVIKTAKHRYPINNLEVILEQHSSTYTSPNGTLWGLCNNSLPINYLVNQSRSSYETTVQNIRKHHDSVLRKFTNKKNSIRQSGHQYIYLKRIIQTVRRICEIKKSTCFKQKGNVSKLVNSFHF